MHALKLQSAVGCTSSIPARKPACAAKAMKPLDMHRSLDAPTHISPKLAGKGPGTAIAPLESGLCSTSSWAVARLSGRQRCWPIRQTPCVWQGMGMHTWHTRPL